MISSQELAGFVTRSCQSLTRYCTISRVLVV